MRVRVKPKQEKNAQWYYILAVIFATWVDKNTKREEKKKEKKRKTPKHPTNKALSVGVFPPLALSVLQVVT